MTEDRGEVRVYRQEGHELSSLLLAAHELKSPLILIRQLAFAASDQTASDQARQEALAQLSLVTERGLRLTNDLTKSARLNPAVFPVEPVNIQQICEAAVKEMSPLYVLYGRRLEFKGSKRQQALVLAHRDLLRRILCNFVDNALNYGDPSHKVVVTARRKQSAIELGVRDYGPRLSARDMKAIWHGAPQTVSTRPGSSGLGLFIARQFSEAMGGSLGVVRHRDGVTFYVSLPISEQLSLL